MAKIKIDYEYVNHVVTQLYFCQTISGKRLKIRGKQHPVGKVKIMIPYLLTKITDKEKERLEYIDNIRY